MENGTKNPQPSTTARPRGTLVLPGPGPGRRKLPPLPKEPKDPETSGFQRSIDSLEQRAKFSNTPDGRLCAAMEIIKRAGDAAVSRDMKAAELKGAKKDGADAMGLGTKAASPAVDVGAGAGGAAANGERHALRKEVARLVKRHDMCVMALERLTDSNDYGVRQRAFDYIESTGSSISARMVYLFSGHPDIRERARELFPRKPDRFYAAIAPAERTSEYDEMARTILSALLRRKGNGTREGALEALDAVRTEINARRRCGMRKDVTDKELVSSARRYLSGKECASVKELVDAFRLARKAERARRNAGRERAGVERAEQERP